jgi:hypothetical protein
VTALAGGEPESTEIEDVGTRGHFDTQI